MHYNTFVLKMQSPDPDLNALGVFLLDTESKQKYCLLDENKLCDDCGECDRCDLDPNKICDNCCKCLAIEDADSEFRTVTLDGKNLRPSKAGAAQASSGRPGEKPADRGFADINTEDEPIELTPELVAYWEGKLAEYGEAPADDGFGEIEVNERIPVKGVRKLGTKHAANHMHILKHG